MEVIDKFHSHDGEQLIVKHYSSSNKCEMKFSLFLPPASRSGKVPIIWYLSGLTCSHANVTEKGEYRHKASELGIAFICPDTSPRGDNIPDEKDNWQFGSGAGFYVDATQDPYNRNYNMFSYVTDELPKLVFENFPVKEETQGIMGHSMGGHGALITALNYPYKFKSCSAIAPIAQPSTAGWSKTAFTKYLGEDTASWRKYDATSLIEDGYKFSNFLIDQGLDDPFLEEGLKPNILKEICQKHNQEILLRMQEGYDHSYYFISTFMNDHINWHNNFFTE